VLRNAAKAKIIVPSHARWRASNSFSFSTCRVTTATAQIANNQ
jgi:hypothetical protein